jgi:hypothetical protein
MDNTVCRADRLSSGERLSLSELVRLSEEQEKEVMAYVLAQPEARFNKLMKVFGARWQEYGEAKLANRTRMRELCDEAKDRVNGGH